MSKDARIYNGKKIVSSISAVGELDRYMQKNESRTFSYTIYKNKLKID